MHEAEEGKDMRIFVTKKGEERTEITDWLYWFEENSIRDFGDLHYYEILIEFVVGDAVIWNNAEQIARVHPYRENEIDE